jgi:hypothetical protein
MTQARPTDQRVDGSERDLSGEIVMQITQQVTNQVEIADFGQ